MTTAQEQFWKGDFGRDYTIRNRVDWSVRVPFWDDIIMWTGARSALEVGCNAGWNLQALNSIDPSMELTGVDVNLSALAEAAASGYEVHELSASEVGKEFPAHADLVFTAGVLIHIPTEQLSEVMDGIIAASTQYVLAIEYASETEEAIDYRGNSERLWRRPFGKLYEDKGLTLIETGDAGEGFDSCTYWLLSK